MLTVFGLNMFVKGDVNCILFNQPMIEIGLPIINMSWFVNNIPVNQLLVFQSFNIDNSITSTNTWTFKLKNFQSNIGASTIRLGPCIQGNNYKISIILSTTSFINGVGVPNLGIPAAIGIPILINNIVP